MLKKCCNILLDDSCISRFAFGGGLDLHFACIATNQLLVITKIEESTSVSVTSSCTNRHEISDEMGQVTSLAWISSEAVCVGFSTGIMLLVESNGKNVAQTRYHRSAVKSICTEIYENEAYLWALHEHGFLILVRECVNRKYSARKLTFEFFRSQSPQ